MKILIVSDSHNRLGGLSLLLEKQTDFDFIVHAGDGSGDAAYLESETGRSVYAVCGNCDFSRIDCPPEQLHEWCEQRVLIVHGHRQNVKSELFSLYKYAHSLSATIVIFGHTHLPTVEYYQDILFINPGSITHPNQGRATYATLEMTHAQPPRAEIHTL